MNSETSFRGLIQIHGDSPRFVSKGRVAAVSLMLLLSALVLINSSSIDKALERGSDNDHQSTPLVGLQENENWLVMKVAFPGKPFKDPSNESLFSDGLVADYIDELSAGKSSLNISVIDDVWNSPDQESHWGMDSDNERDTGDGSGGAAGLASIAIETLLGEDAGNADGFDLSNWDLNNDGVIDRLLLLHSGEPQESGGPNSAIWSHFSWLQDPLVVGEFRVEHYTMVSKHSGQGVIIHEMLHQMGAVDLYDVHSDTPSANWHGLGDWDIMASGNWIGGGDKPSLPSASTLNLIGASEPIDIDVENDAMYDVKSISAGGQPLSISIAPDETIWISFRSNRGFDTGLPGFGVLVEQQDFTFGELDSNTVNSDPEKAWSKIVEADGDGALLRARDHGSQGDVFVDGGKFGNSGIEIRDNRGRLVPWLVTVNNSTNVSANIHFTSNSDINTSVLPPRSPVELLLGEKITFDFEFRKSCVIESTLNPSNMENTGEKFGPGSYDLAIFDSTNATTDIGVIEGKIGCLGNILTDVSLKWVIVGNRLSNSSMQSTIHWKDQSVVNLYPEFEGDAQRTYSVSLQGPISRISSTESPITLKPGDPIILSVDPKGLLDPGMIARGEIVLSDTNNLEQRIPIILNANSDNPIDAYLSWIALPSNAIALIFVIIAASIATGRKAD